MIEHKNLYEKTQIRDAFKLHLSSLHEVVVIVNQDKAILTYPSILSPEMAKEFEHFNLHFNLIDQTYTGFEINGYNKKKILSKSKSPLWTLHFDN